MFKEIQIHQLKAYFRSPALTGELVAKILMGIGVLYFLIIIGFLSYYLPEILGALSDSSGKPELVFGSYFLFYLLIDLIARLFFQPLPGVNYTYYALFPIKKKKLINSLLLSSLLNVFCFVGLLLVMPFLLRHMIPELGVFSSLIWLAGVIMAILINHYLAVWLKFLINNKPGIIPALFLGAVLLAGLQYLGFLSIYSVSGFLFGENTISGVSLIFLGTFVLLVFLVARFLMLQMVYSESSQSQLRKTGVLFAFTHGIKGIVATLFFQELILILRNKRTRKLLFFTPIIVVLFLYQYHKIVFPAYIYEGDDFIDLISGSFFLFFPLGFWLISYGQFLTGWESSFYDGLAVLPIDIKNYLLAKWLILAVPITVFYFLLFPISVVVWSNVFQLTAVWMFLCGPVILGVLLSSIFNKKRITLNSSGMMNNQGASSFQMIFLPLIFFLLFSSIIPFLIFEHETLGFAVWLATGLMVVISHSFWLSKLAMVYKRFRYKKLENFRKKIA